MVKVFLVSGTHANERRFAGPVADRLEKLIGNRHDVEEIVRVKIPASGLLRKRANIAEMQGKADLAAYSVYLRLRRAGFEPSNPNHRIIDVHENPRNWREVYPDDADFYEKHVEPHIERSIREGTHGVYFAEIRGSQDYLDIRSMRRGALSELPALLRSPSAKARILRIEVPVIARKGSAVAQKRKTPPLAGARSSRVFIERIADAIMARL